MAGVGLWMVEVMSWTQPSLSLPFVQMGGVGEHMPWEVAGGLCKAEFAPWGLRVQGTDQVTTMKDEGSSKKVSPWKSSLASNGEGIRTCRKVRS
eukprot:2147697-Amphidinium_carterae.1